MGYANDLARLVPVHGEERGNRRSARCEWAMACGVVVVVVVVACVRLGVSVDSISSIWASQMANHVAKKYDKKSADDRHEDEDEEENEKEEEKEKEEKAEEKSESGAMGSGGEGSET